MLPRLVTILRVSAADRPVARNWSWNVRTAGTVSLLSFMVPDERPDVQLDVLAVLLTCRSL